jgi:hypothetical protein
MINTAFKVTKSSKAVSTKAKSQPRGKDHLSQPMRPISPQAARSNGPTQPILLFPNLQKRQKPQNTQLPLKPEQVRVNSTDDNLASGSATAKPGYDHERSYLLKAVLAFLVPFLCCRDTR